MRFMYNLRDRIAGRKHKEIYALIRKHGTVTKTDLIGQCDMTVSTLTRTLEELVQLGYISEMGRGKSRGGRRPVLYGTNPDAACVFGLDISRAYSRLLLCNLHLQKIDSVVWAMTRQMTPEWLLGSVVEAVRSLMDKHRLNKKTVLGMGVGSVGPLDRIQGMILDPPYFPAEGWRNVKVVSYLESHLDIPVVLDNGANAGLWAEYWVNKPGQHREHLLYIRTGVGLRSAMMSNGQLVYGAFDMEAAIGLMIIQTDGIKHRYREHSYGCLESYVSTYALEQEAISKLKQGRKSVLLDLVPSIESLQFGHLLEALRQNDPLTVEIFTQAATYFGIGLANLLNILHPQRVILGGPLIIGNDLFFQTCTDIALRNTYHYPSYDVEFVKEKLGEDTIATGAAAMVINALTD